MYHSEAGNLSVSVLSGFESGPLPYDFFLDYFLLIFSQWKFFKPVLFACTALASGPVATPYDP
jgi:hypothetical protein